MYYGEEISGTEQHAGRKNYDHLHYDGYSCRLTVKMILQFNTMVEKSPLVNMTKNLKCRSIILA
jgi:hypothetical protein